MIRRAALLVLVLVVAGCAPPPAATGTRTPGAAATRPQHPDDQPSSSPRPSSTPRPARPPADPYIDLARRLHARDVEVWFETDLVQSWLDGPTDFRETVRRLAVLARVPGVAGFKIADELGYGDGLSTPRQVERFLHAAHAALAAAAPGKQVLVDMVVPQLGCLPWRGDGPQRSCAEEAGRADPAATVAAVSRYLRTGVVDRLDLSTGLLEPESYERWGLTRQEAQRQAWEHVRTLGWARRTALQARKALAAPGGYQGSRDEAEDDVATFVEEPLAGGAGAVDIWTWRQPYQGAFVSLLDEELSPNPLWLQLGEQAQPVHLFTHMTPSAMPTDPVALQAEVDLAATRFGSVFVAAGTG